MNLCIFIAVVAFVAVFVFGMKKCMGRKCSRNKDGQEHFDDSVFDVDVNSSPQEKIADDSDSDHSGASYFSLDDFPFLEKCQEMEELMLSEGYHSIKYLYSPSDGKHYRIKYECLHSDENKLSTLRVKLLEQLQADSEHPLLVCSCCNRPVLLSGNSGLKGEIIGFRHFGEGNIYTGEHVGENITVPKQEDEAELNYMAVLFSEYAPLLEEYERHQSFLLMPGMERDRPGDITFEYEGKKVAVIFASAGHPLDFIIRLRIPDHCRPVIPA